MRNRVLVPVGAVILMVLCTPVLIAAQTRSGTAKFDAAAIDTEAAIQAAAERARTAAAAAANWTPPRTAWGDPNLQGYWLLATYTPLERPAALAGKAFYSEKEALAAFRYAVKTDSEVDPRTVHYDWKEYGMDGWQSPIRLNLRTSLIVDPPNGRIPSLTPEAQRRPPIPFNGLVARGTDVRSAGLYTRCVTGIAGPPLVHGGNPGSDMTATVTAESQLLQTPGYVVLVMQSNNDVRIIPLDGRPRLAQTIRPWLGDARGHWEGNTLVVETTNFNPQRDWHGSSDGLHLVERFTLVDPQTLRYEFTVTDPTTWTRPWTVESPLPRIEPPIYEFACHEQNYGLINVVTGDQIRAAEPAATQGSAR